MLGVTETVDEAPGTAEVVEVGRVQEVEIELGVVNLDGEVDDVAVFHGQGLEQESASVVGRERRVVRLDELRGVLAVGARPFRRVLETLAVGVGLVLEVVTEWGDLAFVPFDVLGAVTLRRHEPPEERRRDDFDVRVVVEHTQ